MHVSGGKGKEENREDDRDVRASTEKEENLHGNAPNGQRKKS